MKPKAIQTRIDAPNSLKEAIDRAIEKWQNYKVVHGPVAYWHGNLFNGQMDAIVLASVKVKKSTGE